MYISTRMWGCVGVHAPVLKPIAAAPSRPTPSLACARLPATVRTRPLHMDCRAEADASLCQLDIMLLWEVYDSDRSTQLYPFNYLRNYAQLQVKAVL